MSISPSLGSPLVIQVGGEGAVPDPARPHLRQPRHRWQPRQRQPLPRTDLPPPRRPRLMSWPGLYNALHSTDLNPVSDSLLARRLFFDLCPFLRVSYLVSNQSILEAMEGEKMMHIVHLSCSEPAQWIALMQALSSRPEGPPPAFEDHRRA